MWVEFARSMGPMMIPAARAIADVVCGPSGALQVLDIAAGHGLFGIAHRRSAIRSRRSSPVDWPAVLAVASEHAHAVQVQDRYRTLPGDAFKVEFPDGFDVALVTNFLHHFDGARGSNGRGIHRAGQRADAQLRSTRFRIQNQG